MVSSLAAIAVALAMQTPLKAECRVKWVSPATGEIKWSRWMTRGTADLWRDYWTRNPPGYAYTFYCWSQIDV